MQLENLNFFPDYRGIKIFNNHSVVRKNHSALLDEDLDIICYDFINPYPQDIPDYLILSKELRTYLQYNIFAKIFNKAVADFADPFLILDENNQPQPFELRYNLINLNNKHFQKNPPSTKIKKIFSLREKKYTESPIEKNDVILGVQGSGLHLVNLDLIWNRIKHKEELWDESLLNRTVLSYFFQPTISLVNNTIHKLKSEHTIKKIIIPDSPIKEELAKHMPEGLKAIAYTNRWGLDHSFKSLLNKLEISESRGYIDFAASLGALIITSKKGKFRTTELLSNGFKHPVIDIGYIEEGNIGTKAELIW